MKIIVTPDGAPICCCGEPSSGCNCEHPPYAPSMLKMSASNQTVPDCPQDFILEWGNGGWNFHGYSGCNDQGGDFNYWVLNLRCEDNRYRLEVNYDCNLNGEQAIITFQCVSLDPFRLTAHVVLKSLTFDAVITKA